MFDPQGVERDVPLEQTAAAVKAGGRIAQPKVYPGAPPDTLPANFDGWDQPEALVEGKIYEWEGTEARWRVGKWVPVKIKNRVCESDDNREKRLAQEQATKQEHQKKAAEAAAAKLTKTCKDWESKHPTGSPPDRLFWANGDSRDTGIVLGPPNGCEGTLETAYRGQYREQDTVIVP